MESTATTYTYQSTSPIPSIIALILCRHVEDLCESRCSGMAQPDPHSERL